MAFEKCAFEVFTTAIQGKFKKIKYENNTKMVHFRLLHRYLNKSSNGVHMEDGGKHQLTAF